MEGNKEKNETIIIGGQEFSTKCPTDCPGRSEFLIQGGLCYRCPIFNCVPVRGENGEEFALLRPEEYRKDWAKAWKEWFDNGMEGYPELLLIPNERE